MGNTRDTGYLRNLVIYDGSGNITLPANLTVTGTITGYATTSYVGTQLGGYVPTTRTISINGTSLDLSANRSFTINSMVYPGAGIAVSTGSAWGTSLTDNSSNWNTAYGWGNHAGLYSLLNHTHTFASLTSKPTTLVGYGITDAATSAQGTSADTAYGWGNHAIVGYLTGITSGQVTTALGFTPYNATNPTGYITSAALSTYATQSYVGTQIANLVASSPAALDTLNELAAALGNDAAFSTTVSTALGNRLRVDTASQGLSATLQGYGRTNLGLGTAATANTGDFVAYRTFGTAANSATGDFVAYRTFGTAANNNTGDFAAASHTHSIANVTGLQTALDGKQASGSYAASSHSHIISDVTGLQTALDGKQASLGFTPYNSTNPNAYIALTALSGSTGISYNSTTGAISSTITQYTDALARAAHSFVAGSGAYNSTTGVITIPTNNNQLTNGAGYITSYTETDTLATVTGRGASTTTSLSLGQVSTSNRLSIGASDQSYASIFVGGAITTGTSQYAILTDPQLAGTDNYALFANARIKASTAVTNAFGVYIPTAEKMSGATITNNYALYIANQTSGSSTNYSIYSSGGRNYFGDKVSIGSNTFFTVAQFLVNGGLSSGSSAIAQFNGFIRMRDQLIIHNDANTALESYLMCSAASEITTLNLKTTNLYASGNLVTIGNWTTATTLQFHSSNNSIGRINFYDGNDTEGVYIRNIGVTHGGDLRFGARWDDDEDKVYFNLRQSSAGAAYDARFGLNVDPTTTFQVRSNGITAGATSKGWPVYDAELDTQSRTFIFETAGNNGTATAGYGATVALVLGQYYDSRVVITPQSNGGGSPGDQGTGHGKDLMIKGGTSDNGVGYKGGRLYLNGGMGYTSGGYNGNFGVVKMQTYGGVVNIGTTTGETRSLNVAYSIGVRANLRGVEEEIFNVGNTGSGVNDGYMRLMDNSTVKVLIAANNSRGGDTYFNGGGNFGINTDAPSSKLEVFSGSTTADALTLSFNTGADNRQTGIFFKGGPYPYARIVGGTSNYGPDQGFIAFYTNYNPSGAASTSGYCLERVRINPNGSIVATGDITAFGSPSDIKLKNIKEVVPNALQSILKLNGYRFDWKDVNHLTKIKEDIGVIAQEVEKVLPELARTNDDGTMSVRYQGLTAVLIEAMKEQQTQIESQKSEIDELKDLVQQLINR